MMNGFNNSFSFNNNNTSFSNTAFGGGVNSSASSFNNTNQSNASNQNTFPSFVPKVMEQTTSKGKERLIYMSLSFMDVYANKSFEECRYEMLQSKSGGASSSANSTPFSSGFTNQAPVNNNTSFITNNPLTSTDTSVSTNAFNFGSSQTSSQPSTSTFGFGTSDSSSNAASNTTSGFPSFGSASSSAPQTNSFNFSSTPSTESSGFSTEQTSGFNFGTSNGFGSGNTFSTPAPSSNTTNNFSFSNSNTFLSGGNTSSISGFNGFSNTNTNSNLTSGFGFASVEAPVSVDDMLSNPFGISRIANVKPGTDTPEEERPVVKPRSYEIQKPRATARVIKNTRNISPSLNEKLSLFNDKEQNLSFGYSRNVKNLVITSRPIVHPETNLLHDILSARTTTKTITEDIFDEPSVSSPPYNGLSKGTRNTRGHMYDSITPMLHPSRIVRQSSMPTLTKEGYFTVPSMGELATMTDQELSSIRNFTVGRAGYGEIMFFGRSDVRYLDLDKIVEICERKNGLVSLYSQVPDHEVPPVNQELNKPALITLHEIRPVGKRITDSRIMSKFQNRLQRSCKQIGSTFVTYSADGTWVFKVECFREL